MPSTAWPDWLTDTIRDAPALSTPTQAAELCGVSRSTICRWVREGRLRALRLTPGGGSGGVRIARTELARVLLEAAGERA